MYSASAWEAQTRELISRIENEMQELQADTARKMAVWNRKKGALEESLVTFREMMYMQDKPVFEVLTPEDIRDKSQKDLLRLIASRNNGLLVANQAIKMMKEAGIFGNPDNASSAVYSVLKRSTKEFDRVGQGVYKLRDWTEAAGTKNSTVVQSVSTNKEKSSVNLPEPETEKEIEEKPVASMTSIELDTKPIVPTAPVFGRLPSEVENPPVPVTETVKDTSWIDNIEPDAIRLIPETIARRYNSIPVSLAGNTLVVAMDNPYDIFAIEAFTTYCHKHITPIAAAIEEISKAIEINYKS
jgi:hypothetical protein